MTTAEIWVPLDRLIYGIGITLYLVTTFFYLIRAKQKESKEEKRLLYYFSIFFVGNGLSMFFFYLADFYYIGNFNGYAYIGVINDNLIPVLELVVTGHLINFIIAIICTIIFENIVKGTRYILTVIRVILLIGYIVGQIMHLDIFYIIVILNGVFYLIPLLWLAMKSSMELQNIALMTLIGLMINFLYNMFRAPELRELNIIYSSFIAFFYILSVIFYIIPILWDFEKLSQKNPIYFWLIFILINAFFGILGVYFLLFPSVPIYIPIATFQINIPIVLILLYLFRRSRKMRFQRASIDEPSKVNILKVFSKPTHITEEDVFISKEKKICLVCKGKVSRFNIYICPGCDSFYCEKCAHTLEKMENACWSCEAPFNELIPRKTILPKVGAKVESEPLKKGKSNKK